MGIPYPDPATVCTGHCEGTGFVPVDDPDAEHDGGLRLIERDAQLDALYRKEHAEHCAVGWLAKLRILWRHRELWYWRSKLREWCDGWHFVKCPDCNGTGKRQSNG